MPAGLIEQEHSVCPRRHFSCDFSQMQAQRLGGTARQDQRQRALSPE
jgi:hypothetical protein